MHVIYFSFSDFATKKEKFDEEVIQDGNVPASLFVFLLLLNNVNCVSLSPLWSTGVRIFVDMKAQLSLLGTEMDYVESELSSEFVFNNPNIKGTCGCGESFSV